MRSPPRRKSHWLLQAPEGEPDRRRQWLLPSPDPATAAHVILFRPPGEGPFPPAIVAHATSQNVLRRAQMPQPEVSALAAWRVARGFAVPVPERPGHGATGGRYLEDQGGCDEAGFRTGGGTVDYRLLAASGSEGRWLVETDSGVKRAAPELDRAPKAPSPTAAKKR